MLVSNSNSNRFCALELDETQAKRRQVVLQLAFTAFSFPAIVSNALAENGNLVVLVINNYVVIEF